MLRKTTIGLLAAGLLFGCGDPSEGQLEDVTFQFSALVNGDAFSCHDSFTMGTSDTTTEFSELKFYISEISLWDGEDERVVALDNDGKWQNGAVALLDFEDGAGACVNGTADMNSVVTGKVPGGSYDQISFSLGVPFDQNHQDSAVADSPLNLTQMFWNWQGGYKFLRVDGKAQGSSGFRVHLGSTGCEKEEGTNDVTSCAQPNRPKITLSGYEGSKTIALNLEKLFEDEDMTPDGDGNSTICMSAPENGPCDSVFEKMDLSFGSNAPNGQQIFSIE